MVRIAHRFVRVGAGAPIPVLRCYVSLPRFQRAELVDLLIDTGADVSLLSRAECRLLIPDAAPPQNPIKVRGVGGPVDAYVEPAFLAFTEEATGRLLFCQRDIRLCYDVDPPSLLGRDVLGVSTIHLDSERGTASVELPEEFFDL